MGISERRVGLSVDRLQRMAIEEGRHHWNEVSIVILEGLDNSIIDFIQDWESWCLNWKVFPLISIWYRPINTPKLIVAKINRRILWSIEQVYKIYKGGTAMQNWEPEQRMSRIDSLTLLWEGWPLDSISYRRTAYCYHYLL